MFPYRKKRSSPLINIIITVFHVKFPSSTSLTKFSSKRKNKVNFAVIPLKKVKHGLWIEMNSIKY